jgi:hypothetical protein
MKALVAAIGLLCLSSSVLAHDIYIGLRDRAGHLCCGGAEEANLWRERTSPGAGSMRLSDISLKVIWEKQRTNTFSHHRRVKS